MTRLEHILHRNGWTLAVLGAQWGDEGKGKIVDRLAEHADIVVRFGGGANAGHTLVINGERHVIHLLPSGIVRAGRTNIVGPAVVCDLEVLVRELSLANQSHAQVILDPAAVIVHPLHKLIDDGREIRSGNSALGTTRRGIGPAYEDLAARRGLRLADLAGGRNAIRHALEHNGYWQEKQALANALKIDNLPSLQHMVDWAHEFSDQIVPHLGDTRAYLARAVAEKKRIVCEGAQGIMLDVFHGQQPFTTSSGCTVGALSASTGLYHFDAVIGVTKAYTTRVGAGPFPTELKNHAGEQLRERGREIGATTGRSRSCGWLDLPALRYACRIGGITDLIMTKLDILNDFPVGIHVCTGYRVQGEELNPLTTLTRDTLESVEAHYEVFPSWSGHWTGTSLPRPIVNYLKRVAEATQCLIRAISYGAERNDFCFL